MAVTNDISERTRLYMRPRLRESGISSMSSDEYDAIEVCGCENDENSPSDSVFTSSPCSEENWNESIVVYKKKIKSRCNGRCIDTHRGRVLRKDGSAYFIRSKIPLRYMRYLRDLSNTVVNSRWRWITLTLVLSFSILWLLFAWLWMLIAMAHGDLEENPRPDTCTVGIEGFAGFLLLSVETQTTIGYGSRYPTENCLEGVFVLCLQMILAIGVQGAILGMVYVKMTRPCRRDSQRLFSRTAVVCQRDEDLCLMFRVADKRRSHIVGTEIKAYLLHTRRTYQGEILHNFQSPLKLEAYGLLLWPLTIVHKIVPGSPFYDISAKDLLVTRFEIVVIMIGSSDSTGQMTQSRTSYLSSEILWGHRFKSCVQYDEEKKAYIIHTDKISATEVVDTPLCSAERIHEVLEELDNNNVVTPTITFELVSETTV